jgi:hypothetical protein
MRNNKKKCICKNCEDCQFYRTWDMTDQNTGLRKQVSKCGFQVLFEELPHLRGAIDGAQQGANEARNRSMENQELIKDLGLAMLTAMKDIPKQIGVIDDYKRLPDT